MSQLHQAAPATLGDAERLVRAYLELMLMRMPERLVFTVAIDPALRTLAFPQMGLLALVENSVRHGIDPGCDPGRIDVGARRGAAGELRLWRRRATGARRSSCSANRSRRSCFSTCTSRV